MIWNFTKITVKLVAPLLIFFIQFILLMPLPIDFICFIVDICFLFYVFIFYPICALRDFLNGFPRMGIGKIAVTAVWVFQIFWLFSGSFNSAKLTEATHIQVVRPLYWALAARGWAETVAGVAIFQINEGNYFVTYVLYDPTDRLAHGPIPQALHDRLCHTANNSCLELNIDPIGSGFYLAHEFYY